MLRSAAEKQLAWLACHMWCHLTVGYGALNYFSDKLAEVKFRAGLQMKQKQDDV